MGFLLVFEDLRLPWNHQIKISYRLLQDHFSRTSYQNSGQKILMVHTPGC